MVVAVLTGIMLMFAAQAGEPPLNLPSGIDPGAEAPSVARQDAAAGLDGKMLVIRWYADWQNAPGDFDLLRVRMEGDRVTIEPGEATVPPFVVITAEDQEDEAVREAIGDSIWAQNLTRSLDLRLARSRGQKRQRWGWQFTDALGEPLVGAAVDIWLVDYYRGARIRFGRTVLDSTGQLAWKKPQGVRHMTCFVVSHPDYGCAEVAEPLGAERRVTVPLVRRGTAAAGRAIHGRVVDPDGAPITGATIDCPNVHTLGEGLINGLDPVGTGITDANGAFSFYLPNRKRQDERGELIPPKSRYNVRISPPKSLGLLPYAELIENGQDALVVLERGDRLRRLRFEDQDGEITDPAKLKTITILLRRPDRNVLMLQYQDWKDGARLVPGTYEASMRGRQAECRFEPVMLTKDSPEELVFKLPAAVTYYGRVVHGITGRPMPGAFVLAMTSSSDSRLCELTPEQWDTLHALAGDGSEDDPALDPLRKIYGFAKWVRTDAAGGYGVALEADESFYGFVAFEQDYLAVMYRRHSLKADKDQFAEVPTIKLFPAATVFVETTVDREYLSIMPGWEIDKELRPAWVEELLGIDNGRESSLEYDDWLKPNTRQAVHVPAGVNLRLRLEAPSHEEFCPIPIPQTIHLAQGQTADLGQFTFEPAIPVQVKVLDSTGQALEGIPIRAVQLRRDGLHWNVPHNTDEQGIARFHVVPNSTGSFGVFYHGDDGVHLKETVDYKVAGREDAGREFVFQLSDEMLAHLLK